MCFSKCISQNVFFVRLYLLITLIKWMRLFPKAGKYTVSLKYQLWSHDYDWESCNDRKCDKDQESDDDQKPHNSGCCKSESEKTIESFFPPEMNLSKCICLNIFDQMYFSKCICQIVFVKMYFFVSPSLWSNVSKVRSV